ncbi:MAG: Nramp family divalent metal transporter [Planctomycetota bacterium]|nr:Nramp family divalent metal transporter [Planctomycetota bacterium]
MSQETASERSESWIEPPEGFLGRLRHIGPGIIISGSIVGSGELVVTTKLGAEVGFVLLWLILFSCFLKVFLQVELGRHVISSGRTVLESMDSVPGPRMQFGRLRVNWLNALWAVMAFCSIMQLGGILTGLAGVFRLPDLGLTDVSAWIWPVAIAALTAALLASGRYKFVELTTTGLVCVFTLLTVVAVFCVQSTSSAISSEELGSGLLPSLPSAGLVTAFAVLGITGVGASELVFYPYWCLEKGYAKFVGPSDGSQAWVHRARGWIRVMHLDAWISCGVYTLGTAAFYLLGAGVLNRENLVPGDDNLHETLSQIYVVSFSDASGTWLYALGAIAVLFSTFFVATASNARVVVDGIHVFGIKRLSDDAARRKMVGLLCIVLPAFCWAMVVVVGKPVWLIMVGGVAQAAFLPFLAAGIAFLRYRKTDPALVQRSAGELCLWLAIVATALVGMHQLYSLLA